MKIFAAGIATETNTFCPVPTVLGDFVVQREEINLWDKDGRAVLDLTGVWRRQAKERGDEYNFSLMAWAPPSGTTTRAAYEALRDEILDDLRAALPVDIVLLMLHGAMIAQGYNDCEEDVLRRIRAIVGDRAVVAVELDLHCHLSEAKISPADIVVTYKEYPHIDSNDRATELFDLAVATSEGHIRPTMALFDCRMMGFYPTSQQPLRGFVDAMTIAEQRTGLLSISFGHGFQFADVPHAGAKVLVVTDNDATMAMQVAREFGLQVHDLRRNIGFDGFSLPLEEALSKACGSKNTPVVVADQSDNPGGGAPGDSTFALQWLLARKAEDVAMAIIYDPEVVKIARKAGVGATLPVRLGGKTSHFSGAPVDIEVTVLSMLSNYVHALPQRSGAPLQFPAGDIVALRCGTIDIIVGTERCQCFSPAIFTDLGIDPTQKRILIPKSAQHFYDAFAPIAGEIIYMAAPGATTTDPRHLSYHQLDTRNMYPWIADPRLPQFGE